LLQLVLDIAEHPDGLGRVEGVGHQVLEGRVVPSGHVGPLDMFVLPAWLFDGPRTIKRYPRRVVCGDCGERWTDGHNCAIKVVPSSRPPRAALRAERWRIGQGRALARRPRVRR
jgi:hypothetical protein